MIISAMSSTSQENQSSQRPTLALYIHYDGGRICRKNEPGGQGLNGRIDAILLIEIGWVFKRQ